MDRSVAAIGATSGSLSALILWLLSGALSQDPAAFECPLCPDCFDWELAGQHIDLTSLLIGLILGIALGPVVEALYLVRASWKIWVNNKWAQLNRTESPLYKLA